MIQKSKLLEASKDPYIKGLFLDNFCARRNFERKPLTVIHSLLMPLVENNL